VGEEVLAADFNTMVQRQVVATFANAAARDAAIPAPTEGMTCYVTGIGFQIYNAVWKPLPGTTLVAGAGIIPVVSRSATGVYDTGLQFNGTTYPYSTVTVANVAGYGGFSGNGITTFNYDIWGLGPNAIVASGNQPIQAQAGVNQSVPISWAWTNGPGVSTGFKVRFFFNSGPGTNCYQGGTANWQVLVA
jgi:hypothetical protein